MAHVSRQYKGHNTLFAKGVLQAAERTRRDRADYGNLKKVSAGQQLRPNSTNWPSFKSGPLETFPGAPCYHMPKVDYTMHRLLPTATAARHPKFAHFWAISSPRWNPRKGGERIPHPWDTAGVKLGGKTKDVKSGTHYYRATATSVHKVRKPASNSYYYRTTKGKRQKVKKGKRKARA